VTATGTRRRTRERIERPDGTRAVQSKPPRADVLWYPRYSWTSVLVRRTHDVELARELAEARWAEVADERPLSPVFRRGWWQTYASTSGPPAGGAEDARRRVVVWCRPEVALPPAAGAGVEFRP
jgi:hypothetical protein